MVAEDRSARAQSRMPTFSSSKLNNRIVKKLIILFLLGVVLGPLGQAQTPIRVAYLSRYPFKKITKHDNESYLLNGRRLHVGRGFAEVQLSVRGYDFSLINAHLKSKRKVPEADQAEMRLQEATGCDASSIPG